MQSLIKSTPVLFMLSAAEKNICKQDAMHEEIIIDVNW